MFLVKCPSKWILCKPLLLHVCIQLCGQHWRFILKLNMASQVNISKVCLCMEQVVIIKNSKEVIYYSVIYSHVIKKSLHIFITLGMNQWLFWFIFIFLTKHINTKCVNVLINHNGLIYCFAQILVAIRFELRLLNLNFEPVTLGFKSNAQRIAPRKQLGTGLF